MKFLLRIIVNAALFIALAGMFPNMIYVATFGVALLTGLILALLDVTLKPLLQLISLPISLLTVGIFALIINGMVLQLALYFSNGQIVINGFWNTVLVAIIISIVQSIVRNFMARNFK